MQRDEVERKVLDIIQDLFPHDRIGLETTLAQDLGADSLDISELIMELEDAFPGQEFGDEEVTALLTVKDVVELVVRKLQ